MLLAQKTWQEITEYLEKDDRIIVPVGSTEQHGPRAVLGTDYLVAEGLAQRAGERAGVLVSPCVSFGMALHHLAFPGTISLRPSTLLRVTHDVLASLARHGFHHVFLLNGHGGNTPAVTAGVAEVSDVYTDLRVKVRSWWELDGVRAILDEAFGDDEGWHATPGETSIVKALHPGIVSDEPVTVPEQGDYIGWVNAPRWRELFPDGSVGAAVNLSSAEWGERLIEAVVIAVYKELEVW